MIYDGIEISEDDKKKLTDLIIKNNIAKEDYWFLDSAIINEECESDATKNCARSN